MSREGQNPYPNTNLSKLFKNRSSKARNGRFFSIPLTQSVSSVQLLSRVWLLQPHGLQHTRSPVHHQLPELTQTHVHWVSDAIQPRWCHPTVSSSVVPFSSHLKSFPALGSFPSGKGSFHQFFASGGQRIGASASAKATICVYFYLFPGLNTWESYTRLDVVNLSVADLRLKSRQDPDS